MLVPLFLILAVALGLRLYQLDRNPPEFFEDEVAAATSAWSIATTGHDVEQTTLPFIRTRLLLQQPIYAFSVVPFWAALGHTPFAARLPGVMFGVATVLLIAWLVRALGRPPEEALLASAIAAIVPWAVHLGRVGWDQASPVPFAVAGVGLLWMGLTDERPVCVVGGAAVLALGAYTYLPALFVNVLLAGLVLLAHARRVRRIQFLYVGVGASVAAVILAPYALALREPLFLARSGQISVFAQGVNLAAVRKAGTYYWWQWTPKGLFSSVSTNLRDKPGAMLFWWMLPFLLIGIFQLARRRSSADLLLLGWLLVGPLPAALTYDGPVPHFSRGTLTMPAVVVVSSAGVFALLRAVSAWSHATVWRTALIVAIAIPALYQGVAYYREYFDLHRGYPVRSASSWYYGTGAALTAVRENVPDYGTVCVDGVSYFTFRHHITHYLGTRPPFAVLEGLRDPACRRSGTYVLARPATDLGVPARTQETISGLDGNPLFRLSVVSGPS